MFCVVDREKNDERSPTKENPGAALFELEWNPFGGEETLAPYQ
jgi:hypothetical protein